MPRVAERIEEGSLRRMRASLPEISSVSWTSFMTGTQPGEHGVFGFTDVDPDTYRLRFPSFQDVAVPTFWDRLGERGHRCVVLNQPATYPARRIPGILVSGFVAVDLSRAVQPLRHLGPLRRLDYRIDIDTGRGRVDHDFLMADLRRTLEARRRAIDHLWEAEDWDYFQVVITGTDRLYHFLFDAVEDASHPRHQAVLDYHRQVDELVGEVFDRFVARVGEGGRRKRDEGGRRERGEGGWGERGEGGRTDGGGGEGSSQGERGRSAEPPPAFFLLSDHGFCAIEKEVQLNAWLRERGWLETREDQEGEGDPDGLERISPGSVAFALDPGRIYLNRQGRFSRGSVGDAGASELAREIATALESLEYRGRKVVRRVFQADEIYSGPRVGDGPDLVALSTPGFDLKASPTAREVFGRSDGLVGMHTWDDAFLITPEPVDADEIWIGELADKLTAMLAGPA